MPGLVFVTNIFQLEILAKYSPPSNKLPMIDDNLLLPLQLPENFDYSKLFQFFRFFETAEPVAYASLKNEKTGEEEFSYAYDKHKSKFCDFVRAMDSKTLLPIYQLVAHLHLQELQKILAVHLREKRDLEEKYFIHPDLKEWEQLQSLVEIPESLQKIGFRAISSLIMEPLANQVKNSEADRVTLSSRNNGLLVSLYNLKDVKVDFYYKRRVPSWAKKNGAQDNKHYFQSLKWHIKSFIIAQKKTKQEKPNTPSLMPYYFWDHMSNTAGRRLRGLVDQPMIEVITHYLNQIKRYCKYTFDQKKNDKKPLPYKQFEFKTLKVKKTLRDSPKYFQYMGYLDSYDKLRLRRTKQIASYIQNKLLHCGYMFANQEVLLHTASTDDESELLTYTDTEKF